MSPNAVWIVIAVATVFVELPPAAQVLYNGNQLIFGGP
jgi:hypothetical protein